MRRPAIVYGDSAVMVNGGDDGDMPPRPNRRYARSRRRSRESQPIVGQPKVAHRMPEQKLRREATTWAAHGTSDLTGAAQGVVKSRVKMPNIMAMMMTVPSMGIS